MLIRISSAFVVMSALCTVSCADDSRPQPKTPDTITTSDEAREAETHAVVNPTSSTPNGASNMTTNQPSTSMTETTSANSGVSPSAAALTDEQILAVLTVANNSEIQQAKLAETKAKDARVKRFADMMISDHTTANMKGVAVAKNDKLTPEASDLKTQLTGDSDTILQSLRGTTDDFDQKYMDAQVREHQQVLTLIDTRLLPNAKSSDVKALIQEVRPKIAAHLKDAQSLLPQLGSSGATTNSPR